MLKRLTDKHDVANAVRDLENTFRQGSQLVVTTIGFPGGSVRETAHWRKDVGVWLAKRSEWALTRHWTAYGVVEPRHDNSIPIAVEINPPRAGVNRRVAGFIAEEGGYRFLCHTGRLGGGRKGISRAAFLAWRGGKLTAIDDGDGRLTNAIVVACIDSEQCVAQLSDFVRAVALFKAGSPAPVQFIAAPEAFNKEFAGQKLLPARDAAIATVNHGVVVNQLAALLVAEGIHPARDQSRDLFVGHPSAPLIHVEVKTSGDTQSVYTGIGQLVLLGTRMPARARFLVLPRPVSPVLKSDLSALGIQLASYGWEGQMPSFESLDRLVHAARV